MSVNQPSNLPASVRQRLLNIAKRDGEAFDLVLTRFALERLLYRMGQSQYHGQFLLKGAMLFAVWGGEAHRPTRDVDLLGFGTSEIPQVVKIFQDICQVSVEPDGLEFLPDTMRAIEIREDQEYQGVRVSFEAGMISPAEFIPIAIVTTIINLASSLGLHTIAEGVETASQLAFLRLQGCNEVQGYYFSRPLPSKEFEAFVRNQP